MGCHVVADVIGAAVSLAGFPVHVLMDQPVVLDVHGVEQLEQPGAGGRDRAAAGLVREGRGGCEHEKKGSTQHGQLRGVRVAEDRPGVWLII